MKATTTKLTTKLARLGSTAVFSLALVAGVGATGAQAQGYDRYNNDNSYGHTQNRTMGAIDIRRIATVNGYAEGFEHGIADRRNRASFEYQHSDEYREATAGYDSNMGYQRDYQISFRSGYQRGYTDGFYGRTQNRSYDRASVYRQYGYDRTYGNSNDGNYNGYNSGNGGRYYDNRQGNLDRDEIARRAAQQGYYDGYQRGQYDLGQGVRRPNPQGHGAYENGLNGWNPEWGSAQSFQQYYRQYFLQGYQAGYGRQTFNQQYKNRWW